MQLKKKPAAGSRQRLAAATLGLLGSAAPAVHADDTPNWDFDSGLLVYQEGGGRVQAIEPVLDATRLLGQDRNFSVKLVFDTLSGASPNGATPASTPQTFSGPSGGNVTYTAQPNQTPLDSSFKDDRVAVSGGYSFPVGESSTAGFGVSGSSEYDFISTGANAHYALDLFQHNTTISFGAAYEADQVKPVGGAPVPMSVLPPPGSGETESEGEDGSSLTKNVADLVVGFTQVLGPATLLQLNLSVSQSGGYQTDPYKILSVVGTDGEPLRYVHESRPDARTKQAVYARVKRFMFSRDVLDLSYRYMTDDWGIKSGTADLSYRLNFSDRNFVEPHLRAYTQGAADFYRAALYDGEETTLAFASADPRLGAFNGYTGGLKYGHTFAGGSQASLRFEYYQQAGRREGIPQQAAAGLQKFRLEPDLSAVMLTVGYRFRW